MADKKQQPYPIVVDIPQDTSAFGRGRALAANVRRTVSDSVDGAVKAITPVNPFARAAIEGAKVLTSQPDRVAIRDFFDGVAGNPKGGKKMPVQPDKPVEQALAQGRASGPITEIAPADKQSQLIAAILGSGLTVNEAAAVTGMMPATAATETPSAKDMVMGQAAKLSEALFQNQVNQATELAKSDPVGAKAVIEKATADHFSRQAGLVGFNPLQLAQAELMGGGDE